MSRSASFIRHALAVFSRVWGSQSIFACSLSVHLALSLSQHQRVFFSQRSPLASSLRTASTARLASCTT